MSKKLRHQIDDYMISVGRYLAWEYPSVYEEFQKNPGRFYDFIGGYLLEGREVPFTAHYVMALIVQDELEKRQESV
jgi:hypothetical protein